MRDNGLNAALSKVYSEHNKNKIQIDRDGIWLSNGENPDEIIVITADCIIVSNDELKTARACVTSKGIVGETIIGKILASEKLYISNKNNNFVIDENGIRADVNSFKVRTENGDNTLTGLLEITSKDLTSKFSDADKQIDIKFSQTAEGIKVDLKNAKDNLQSNIETTAKGLTVQFTEQYRS